MVSATRLRPTVRFGNVWLLTDSDRVMVVPKIAYLDEWSDVSELLCSEECSDDEVRQHMLWLGGLREVSWTITNV